MIKEKIFEIINNNDIEIYMMWIVIGITLLILLIYVLCYFTDYSETYMFIKEY